MLSDRDKELIEFTVQKTLESIGYVQPQRMSQNQAYKKYGEGIVKRWVRQGKVVFERRGTSKNSTKSVLVEDLERIHKSELFISLNFKHSQK